MMIAIISRPILAQNGRGHYLHGDVDVGRGHFFLPFLFYSLVLFSSAGFEVVGSKMVEHHQLVRSRACASNDLGSIQVAFSVVMS